MGWYTDYKKRTVEADMETGQGARLNQLIVTQLVGPIMKMGESNLLDPLNNVSVEASQAMSELLKNDPSSLEKLLLVMKNQEVDKLATMTKEYKTVIKPALDAFDQGDDAGMQSVVNWLLRLENLKSFSIDNLFVSISNQAKQMFENT
jgi:hypothetical protein